jgi:hypothetical protein
MAIITLAEVKTILQLEDSYKVSESVTCDSVVYTRLVNKPNVSIISVSPDTVNSTVRTTQYDTTDYYTTKDNGNYEIIRRIDTGTIGDTDTIYVSYTYNDYDALITALIPLVQDDLVNYLHNCFPDYNTQYEASTLTLNDATPATITDSESRFVIEGFEGGMDLALAGSFRNEGIYNVTTVAAGTLTLTTGETLLGETSTDLYGGNIITLTRVIWPNEIKQWVAQIIWQNVSRIKNSNVKSKSLGPSSITYSPIGMGGYSDSILKGLSTYKISSMA